MGDKFTPVQMAIWEFLATPAHAWLWVCAKLVGGHFVWGPVEDDDDD